MKKTDSKKVIERSNKKGFFKKTPLIIGLIVISIIIILVVLVINNKNVKKDDSVVGIYTDNSTQTQNSENIKILEDGSKENISTKLKEEKNFEGLVIKDIQFKIVNGETVFTANVENTSDKDFKGSPTVITFIDKNGKTLYELGSYIDDTSKGSTSLIKAIATIDNIDVYDFTIKYKVD